MNLSFRDFWNPLSNVLLENWIGSGCEEREMNAEENMNIIRFCKVRERTRLGEISQLCPVVQFCIEQQLVASVDAPYL